VRNLQNLLITKDWGLWMIDHTRAFRLHKKVIAPKNIERCDRKLRARLKELDRAVLRENLLPYVTPMEIDGLLGRRDHIDCWKRIFKRKARIRFSTTGRKEPAH
jgi:hypothetical protein